MLDRMHALVIEFVVKLFRFIVLHFIVIILITCKVLAQTTFGACLKHPQRNALTGSYLRRLEARSMICVMKGVTSVGVRSTRVSSVWNYDLD